jgi:hypothetical protein
MPVRHAGGTHYRSFQHFHARRRCTQATSFVLNKMRCGHAVAHQPIELRNQLTSALDQNNHGGFAIALIFLYAPYDDSNQNDHTQGHDSNDVQYFHSSYQSITDKRRDRDTHPVRIPCMLDPRIAAHASACYQTKMIIG